MFNEQLRLGPSTISAGTGYRAPSRDLDIALEVSAMGLVLLGGMLGFATAAGGLILGLSPWAALGIWAGSGPIAALLAIGLSQSKGSKRRKPMTMKAVSATR